MSLPHAWLRTENDKELFLVGLFDRLWESYRAKMPYVQKYEALVAARGARFTNDHIAFRTLASQKPALGIFCLSRLFEALGYTAAACYEFPDKHLSAMHLHHPRPGFPKIFISQLNAWALSPKARRILAKYLTAHGPLLSNDELAAFAALPKSEAAKRRLFSRAVKHFETLPWPIPEKKDVLALDKESQYGAWTLVNGYGVNHFTAAVDGEGPGDLNDIEKVTAAMAAAGIPMKKEIEGARGSKLRQTSTESVVSPALMRHGARRVAVPWTYAYFEIAERPLLTNAAGVKERFEGFLGGQATHLFEMTKFPTPPAK